MRRVLLVTMSAAVFGGLFLFRAAIKPTPDASEIRFYFFEYDAPVRIYPDSDGALVVDENGDVQPWEDGDGDIPIGECRTSKEGSVRCRRPLLLEFDLKPWTPGPIAKLTADGFRGRPSA